MSKKVLPPLLYSKSSKNFRLLHCRNIYSLTYWNIFSQQDDRFHWSGRRGFLKIQSFFSCLDFWKSFFLSSLLWNCSRKCCRCQSGVFSSFQISEKNRRENKPSFHRVCQTKLLFLGLILSTFEASNIFGFACAIRKKWLEPQTNPQSKLSIHKLVIHTVIRSEENKGCQSW